DEMPFRRWPCASAPARNRRAILLRLVETWIRLWRGCIPTICLLARRRDFEEPTFRRRRGRGGTASTDPPTGAPAPAAAPTGRPARTGPDRKSTRLNSSH